MKRKGISGLAFVAASGLSALLLFPSCSKPQVAGKKVVEEEAPEDPGPSLFDQAPLPLSIFPFDRTLTDQKGREIEASVIGRSANSIIIVRKGDRREFKLAIDLLAEEDQKYCKRLPFIQPKKPRETKEQEIEKAPYIVSREKEIEDLKQERLENGQAMREESSAIKLQTGKSKEKRLTKEIDRLQAQVDEYRARN